MHFAWQFSKKWAICGVVATICWARADVALAQKFARRSQPTTTSQIISSSDEEIVLQPTSATSTPIRVRQTPGWQQAPMTSARYRSMAGRHGRRGTMQELTFRSNQPTPAPEAIGPGAVDGEVIHDGVVEDDVIQEEVVGDGYLEDMLPDESDEMSPGCATCGDGMFDGHECGPGCNASNCPRYVPCDGICIPRHRVEEHSLFIGPTAFKGPLDLGRNGNFGFNEGVNFAGQFGRRLGLGFLGLGYQVGANFVQSDFYGNQVNGVQSKGRDQQFVTAGLFRRARRRGWQGGAVFDYLHDNYYVKYNVGQVRAELSYLTPCGHEFGFFGAFAVRSGHGNVNNPAGAFAFTQGFQTISYYNMFYRYNLPNGTWGRLWGGASGTSGGMVGADFRMPLANNWDLNGMFNYLIPGAGSGVNGQSQEGWGMGMNLVWYPGRPFNGVHNGYYRSLFNVANNGLMFVRQN